MPLSAVDRIEALADALPFIQKLQGLPLVIKYGGSAMEEEQVIERTLRDVALLAAVGLKPVIVHGGGKAISTRMRDAGIKPIFVGGLRLTDKASMRIVANTLDDVVNGMIVSKLRAAGCKAVGLSGRKYVEAKKAAPIPTNDGLVELGYVGDVERVLLDGIQRALERGEVPIMSPIGRDSDGQDLNVNADTVAGATAGALGAGRLVYISDVLGLMRDPKQPDSLIPSLQSVAIERLLNDGIIVGGMIPKVESALFALSRGVERAHLIDGRIPHALLMALFTLRGIGTEILP
jgi:acetylglutamate kinase